MFKRGVLVVMMGVASACGDDGGSVTMIDGAVPPFTGDLSCINNKPTMVPATVHLNSSMFDVTSRNMFPSIPNPSVRVYSLDGSTMLAMTTGNASGEFVLSIPTGGMLAHVRYAFEVPGYPPLRSYESRAPWASVIAPGTKYFVGAKQERLDAVAASLGTTVDATKGSLEVAMNDCSGNDFPHATLSIAEAPDTRWAMYVATGIWSPGSVTQGHALDRGESGAATVNLEPGLKTVTLKAGDATIGPVTIYIEAGTYTFLHLVPGYPR